ncbi:IS66 family transposase [Tuanshanicoccus lijuaniae]|uniref:IS66 family transposase n=1 Tax=Aerococcaceae bacterium zg-1292 TaxID=2774330 RepID=UPI00193885E3|nr:IS66 family transposase [Aerococcaceae bacterium zg-1292]
MSNDQLSIAFLLEIAESFSAENEALKADKEALIAENEALKADKEALIAENEALKAEKEALKADKEALIAENEALKAEKEASRLAYENELTLLREQLQSLKQFIFGRSSEKTAVAVDESGEQLSLFDLDKDNDAALPQEEKEEETITYKRRKPKTKGKRQAVLDQLESVDIHHELEGDACVCEACQSQLTEIGTSCYRRETVFIPAQLKCYNHIQHAYKCTHCSQQQATDVIVKAPVPKAPIEHSFGSASVIAHTIHQKYTLKVPNYRQEEDWQNMDLPITRKEITNWQILVCQYYLSFLYTLLMDLLVQQPILHADETPFRVLDSKTEKTYYWVLLSEKDHPQGITFYHHDPSRGAHVIKELLGDYKGYLHCDMYQGYQQLPYVKSVGCWAHVRRKFFEANPKKGVKGLAKVGLDYCDRLFHLEDKWADLSPEERCQQRQEKMLPVMDEFFNWCRNQRPLKGSKLQKAIDYALNHEVDFRTVLEDGRLVLSNNLAERAIKALVMGRKNWLFSKSFEGAKSNAIIMTILETAKRHHLNTERYMAYLLEQLPNEPLFEKNGVLEAYLPWNENIQKLFRVSEAK